MNISATEFQNQFGQYLTTSLPEPIIVENQGRKMGVWIGYQEYERLMESLEDAFWAIQAAESEKEGFLGEDSLSLLLKMAAEKGVVLETPLTQ